MSIAKVEPVVFLSILLCPKGVLLTNNQYKGRKEQRALFGVLKIATQETQTQVKLKVYSREEKESGVYKGKNHKAVV